jgi:hypothetical protein
MPQRPSTGAVSIIMDTNLFFGASTGRTATMHLANCLNAEVDCTCVHEGKFRHRETSGEQILPFLTLENRIAYETPEKAQEIINSKRAIIDEIDMRGVSHFGDIAYNYSPFLLPLSIRFPKARFLILVRDGRSFVRSATILEGEDETPVGWPPEEKDMSRLERYIALGRLQPRRGSELEEKWSAWSFFEKNVWLWAETNTILLDSLKVIEADRWLLVKFEDFVSDALGVYSRIREFLDFKTALSEEVKSSLLSPVVNARKTYGLATYDEWSESQKAHFHQYAGSVMDQLGYAYDR